MKAKISLAAVCAAAGINAVALDAAVWRGETAYIDIPAGVSEAMLPQNGATQGGVSIRLARYEDVSYEMQPDGVDMRTRPDVYREDAGRPPSVARITAAPDAKPGRYAFGPLELTVVDRVLPPAKEWKYFLDLWQHPWAVARYFNVKPFSKEHYAKMEPVWRTLAESGCKALTVTILDLPWNNQCYDGYHSMIKRVHTGEAGLNDSMFLDFTLFDEYVEFGRKCGIGPDIACYTMCPWGYRATWEDEKGGIHREKLLPGTPEFETYWRPFLLGFATHLKEKGWFEDAYIAMDERSPEDVRNIINLIQKYAPGMKVSMAGNKSPSEFSGMKIDNYCQGLIHLGKHPKLFDELEPRRKAGFKTTFYVCCTAAHPNTFMESPADEGYWLGAYPVMAGFDGFLRWAANSWPKDPYKDASFKTKNWKAGDTFLVYPNGEPSSRLVALRAGIVAAEKMRLLKEAGVADDAALKRLAKPYGYKGAVNNAFDFSAFRRDVEAFVNAEAGKRP